MKLIRDKIPEIARAKGEEMDVRIAGEDEYDTLLRLKLYEEVVQYLDSRAPEELADIIEVVFALGTRISCSEDALLHSCITVAMSATHERESEDDLLDRLLERSCACLNVISPEQLFEILFVVEELGARHGLSPQDLRLLRERKRDARGGFEGRIVWNDDRD